MADLLETANSVFLDNFNIVGWNEITNSSLVNHTPDVPLVGATGYNPANSSYVTADGRLRLLGSSIGAMQGVPVETPLVSTRKITLAHTVPVTFGYAGAAPSDALHYGLVDSLGSNNTLFRWGALKLEFVVQHSTYVQMSVDAGEFVGAPPAPLPTWMNTLVLTFADWDSPVLRRVIQLPETNAIQTVTSIVELTTSGAVNWDFGGITQGVVSTQNLPSFCAMSYVQFGSTNGNANAFFDAVRVEEWLAGQAPTPSFWYGFQRSHEVP